MVDDYSIYFQNSSLFCISHQNELNNRRRLLVGYLYMDISMTDADNTWDDLKMHSYELQKPNMFMASVQFRRGFKYTLITVWMTI